MTPSSLTNSTGVGWSAKFSDGQSARSWPAKAYLNDRGVVIVRDDQDKQESAPVIWPYGALNTPVPLSRSMDEALVTYTYMPGAQLFVSNADFVAQLLRKAPQLSTSSHRWRSARPLILVALALVVLSGACLLYTSDAADD